jgi:hypothetical protein
MSHAYNDKDKGDQKWMSERYNDVDEDEPIAQTKASVRLRELYGSVRLSELYASDDVHKDLRT